MYHKIRDIILSRYSLLFVGFCAFAAVFGVMLGANLGYQIDADIYLLINVVLAYIDFVLIIYIVGTYDMKQYSKMLELMFVKLFVFAMFVIFVLTWGMEWANALVWIWFGMSLLFLLDSRLSVMVILNMLIYVPVEMMFGHDTRVETLAVYIYVFLVMIVVLHINEYLILGDPEEDIYN